MQTTKERAVEIAMAMHRNESCHICGKIIGDDIDPVFAGYSKGDKNRAAHRNCWDNQPEKEHWTFPLDA